MLAPSSYGTYTKVSVQPTPQHQPQELAGSRRSPLAMPSGQGRRMVGHMYGGNQSRVASQFLVRK